MATDLRDLVGHTCRVRACGGGPAQPATLTGPGAGRAPPRIVQDATPAGTSRAVLDLRLITQPRRHRASSTRRSCRDDHPARLRADLRQLNRDLAAAPPADPTRRSPSASLPSIPGINPAPAPPPITTATT